MPRRRKSKPSLFSPAGELIRRVTDTDSRLRRRIIRFGRWGLFVFFLYSAMSGTYGFPRIIRLTMERRALEDNNRRLLVQLADQRRLRDLLRSDPAYIEYVARTQYHMVAPDETLYRYRNR